MNTIRKAIQTGYRLTNLNDYPAMSQETTAYTATITKHGQEVGTIRNDGRGGADLPTFPSRDTREGFEMAARLTHPESEESWAVEEFLGDLRHHAVLAREVDAEKGTVIQDPDAGDWLDSHTYQVTKYGPDEVIDALRSIGGWRIWDADGGDFRPIV